ncbi:MAG TPA: hypothetical protein VL860_15680 [Planctomycetota bacterium]|nr:hypothetical protein [Planctomycetota bacterium]
MSQEPIKVELTVFNQLQILRDELEARTAELAHLEGKMREIQFEIERIRYLGTIDPMLAQVEPPKEYAEFPKMEERRQSLYRAVAALKANLQVAETETGGAAGGSAGQRQPSLAELRAQKPPAAKRSRFDTF